MREAEFVVAAVPATAHEDLARALATVPDVPRLLSRLSVNAGTPRDLALLGEGLARAARVIDAAGRPYRATLLRKGGEASPEAFPLGLADRLRAELFETAPLSAKEGGKIQLFIPPELAYGDRGPLAHQTLIFDVELIAVGGDKPGDAAQGNQSQSE